MFNVVRSTSLKNQIYTGSIHIYGTVYIVTIQSFLLHFVLQAVHCRKRNRIPQKAGTAPTWCRTAQVWAGGWRGLWLQGARHGGMVWCVLFQCFPHERPILMPSDTHHQAGSKKQHLRHWFYLDETATFGSYRKMWLAVATTRKYIEFIQLCVQVVVHHSTAVEEASGWLRSWNCSGSDQPALRSEAPQPVLRCVCDL